MAVTAQQVQQLYVGYLGRAADQAGLDYWLNELNAENATLTLENLRSNFVNEQPEYAAAYQGLSRQQTVSQIYQNVFGRTPTDTEVAYWTFESNVNTDQLITAFFNAASPTDRLIIENNVAVAQQVTSAYAGSSLTGTALTTRLNDATDDYMITATTTGTGSSAVTTYQVGGTGDSYPTIQAAAAAASQAVQTAFGTTFSGAAGATLAPNFFGTAATITLNNLNDEASITLANQAGGNLHDLTINGSVGAAGAASSTLTLATDAGTTAAPADPTVTTDITSLNLGLTSNTTVVLPTLTDLKTIDASTSTGNLTVDASAAGFTQLTNVVGGSGNDTLTVGAIAPQGSLNVAGGAGNDTLTVVSGNGALTVDAGAGNDIVALTAGPTTTATDARSTAITLGEGNDRLNVTSLANLTGDNLALTASSTATQVEAANAALMANMVTVTDFNTSQDVLSFTGLNLASFNNIELGNIGAAGSLAQALSLVSASLTGDVDLAVFNHGGNTYVYADNSTEGVNAGDGLIQLTGVSTALTEGGNLLVA